MDCHVLYSVPDDVSERIAFETFASEPQAIEAVLGDEAHALAVTTAGQTSLHWKSHRPSSSLSWLTFFNSCPTPSKFRSRLKQRLYLVRCTHSATIQDTGVAPALVTGAVEAQSQRPAEGLSQCDAGRGFRAAPAWSGAVAGRSRQQLPGRGCGQPHGQQATVGRPDEQELVRSRVFHVR